jgi:carbamate kinase
MTVHDRPLVVIALGGNALLRRGEPMDAEHQRKNIDVAARAIARLDPGYRVVITHGNGPQVGLLALQAEAMPDTSPYPLDVLGAESDGMIGYLIAQALGNHLSHRQIGTLLTQVVVDADDPAFEAPTKPIGPIYDEAAARRIAHERGWTVAPDGPNFRRVVPSPQPRAVVEIDTIRILLEADVIVVCVGGGGIPVVADGSGLRGVEAVVDKDLSAALLAQQLDADTLVLVTDVDAVQAGWGTPEAYPIRHAHPEQLRDLQFAAGSMAPKVEAACRFVEATSHAAVIGSLDQIGKLVTQSAGTIVTGESTIPTEGHLMFSKIVVALDGSAHSLQAVEYAKRLSPDKTARIDVVHVRELLVGRGVGGEPVKLDEQQVVEQVEAVEHDLIEAGYDVHLQIVSTVRGGPAHIIADIAKTVGADVIVVGTRGHGPVAGLLLGSVTQRLLHLAPCPVLAVPTSVGERSGRAAATPAKTTA